MLYENVTIDDLKELAIEIASRLKGNELILLEGDLASGKTTFTGFLLSYFGINHVKSPTFNIVNHYEAQFSFYHFDLYRLKELDYDILELLEDENSVRIVEWPFSLKPEHYLLIRFRHVSDDLRNVEVINNLR